MKCKLICTCDLILLLCFVREISSSGQLNDTDEYHLVRDLFDDYVHSNVRPVKNSSHPVKVEFQMKLSRLVKVNSRETRIVTDVWVTQNWSNPFLSWDPKKYGGISTIRVHPKDVWVPDTALVNNAESDFAGSRAKYKTLVVLNSDGQNIWMTPATFHSSCPFDVSFFPFDAQVCEMVFGSLTFTNDKMSLSPMSKSNHFTVARYESGDWSIPIMKLEAYSIKHDCCAGKFDRIKYKMKLKRKPVYFVLNLIVPSILISLLVLFSFKIPVDSGERIGLCTTALLAMSVFLLLIGEHLPESSENIPLLAIASVLMMMEITMGFLATVLVLKCHHSTRRPPKFLTILCCVKSTKPSRSSVDAGNEEESDKCSTVNALLQAQMSISDVKQDNYQEEWQQIAKTLDQFFFIFFLLALCGTLAGVYLLAPFINEIEHNV